MFLNLPRNRFRALLHGLLKRKFAYFWIFLARSQILIYCQDMWLSMLDWTFTVVRFSTHLRFYHDITNKLYPMFSTPYDLWPSTTHLFARTFSRRPPSAISVHLHQLKILIALWRRHSSLDSVFIIFIQSFCFIP